MDAVTGTVERGKSMRRRRWTTAGEAAAYEKGYIEGRADAQQRQWIPCEERLPEPGVNVLVDVLDIPADDRFPLVDKIGDDGDWCNCYGEWFAVAWVPIPDPWEGENDG